MDLKIIQSNAHSILRDALNIIAVQGVAERSGRAYSVAAWMYHRLALCEMLTRVRTDRFQVYLCKSALIRVQFQRLVASGRTFDASTVCSSRSFSFVDAVSAGQLVLAVELARLAPDQHLPRAEYEDDFLLQRFMQKRLLNLHAGEDHDFQALLERWEQVVTGEHAPYLDVCRALVDLDADAFHEALLAAIEEHRRDSRQKDDDARRTDGAVFMTGLALLRLAELGGLSTQREYPNVPHMARLPVGNLLLSPDAWKNPDQALPR